jgi:PAS domain S-box-containing protein
MAMDPGVVSGSSKAAAFERSPVPALVVGADGSPVEANLAFRELFGLGPDDPLGPGPWDRLHESDRRAVEERWEPSQHLEALDAPLEVGVLDARGVWRRMLMVVTGLPEHGHRVLTLIDVTVQREIEAQVVRSAQYGQALLDQAADAVVVLEADGTLHSVNRRGTALFGFAPGSDPPGGVLDLVHPDDAAEAAEQLRLLLATPGSRMAPTEVRVLNPSGGYRAFEAVGVNLVEDPTIRGVVISGRDITERHEAREALARSEQRYAELIEAMQEGLWVIDREGVTTLVNPRMAEMLGTTPADMFGTHLFDWITASSRVEAADRLAVRRTGITEVHEFTFRRRDGSDLPALVATTPRMADGVMVEAIAVVTDVSLLKATEADLEAALAEAQAANRAKSVFLSHVSHELRTPLHAVVGYAEILQGSEDPPTVEYAGRIAGAGDHLARIVDDLLTITRLESGQVPLRRELVVLDEAVVAAAALAAVPEDRLVVLTNGETVIADADRLVQVLVNLLANSLRHGPPGGTVTVRSAATGDTVTLSVLDDGPGFDPGVARRIFEPFVQLGSAGPGSRPGSGLGLAITRTLVEAMGATIRAEPGAPTCFTLELRAAQTDHADAPSSGGAVTVAVIDDDQLNLELLGSVFGRDDRFSLVTAATLRDGSDLIARHAPRALLLDINLPDGSGLDLLRRLRTRPRTSAMPVIVLTADASPELRAEALAAGATDVCVKPYSASALLGALAERLHLWRG